MNWMKSFFNEPGTKEGSSHRLLLVLLVVTVLVQVVFLTLTTGKLPEVPVSLQNLVEYLGTILVGGVAFGKGIKAYSEVKGKEATDVPVAG